MSEKQRIAIVEDHPAQRIILTRLLQDRYDISEFSNGDEFLACPDTFSTVLLDIEMPGMDGYATCRTLRSRSDGTDIPVIFVSGHDTPPERMAAYDAGGDDFISKPIDTQELHHKVNATVARRLQMKQLAEQCSSAQQVAFTAMLSMSDLGVVIEFLRRSTSGNTLESIARQLVDAMATWDLKGAVQVRDRGEKLNLSTDPEIKPLQSSVLDTLQDIGRLFEFGSRAVVNYEHVSLLIENLPTDDPEKVGRLKDNLAVLAESANVRLAGLQAIAERDLQRVGIEATLAELRSVLAQTTRGAHVHREAGSAHMTEQLGHLERTVENLSLSRHQKDYVIGLVQEANATALNFFAQAMADEQQFAAVVGRLERLAAADYRL